MRSITELKNIHIGEDIYIIAAGKSLDFFNLDFFDGKLLIGVNQVYKKIDCDYIVRKEPKFIEESLHSGSIVIMSELHSGDPENGLPKNTEFSSKGHEDALYYFKHKPNKHVEIDFNLKPDEIIVSYSTITSAMHIASYMGASNIIIVGHDCGLINDEFVFKGYYKDIKDTPWQNWNQYLGWLTIIEDQTIKTKQFLKKKYGTNVVSLNPFINFGLEGNVYQR